ncbi:CHC2 zinc finger domain-containing protein [Methylomagnum ishizawai]|uniref:CHC2 zinc finger domain-containing protein n=1 Tax=Methylomagnum ishizawai TaxID=1760988 RepID=UPI000A14DE1D|nr:CHC2 zinc finger domain-containing protein [Methylomagnum ishizawai]
MSLIDTQAVLQRVDIVEVVQARVPLKKQGREWIACCPFHDERTPSFKVNQTKQIYKCFGCGASGDATD